MSSEPEVPRLRSTLLDHRSRRSWTQSRMAELAGISRQSYSAIESGRSVPSTEVALRLAGALGIPVEALFELALDSPPGRPVTDAGVGALPRGGGRVRLARMGGRELAYPLTVEGGGGAIPADGTAIPGRSGQVQFVPFPHRPPAPDLIVAGCDPAFALVAEYLRRERGLEVLGLPAGSQAALDALARGVIHVAGIHLRDAKTGTYNEPWVRRLPFPTVRVVFAVWEQVLILSNGNPLGVRGVEDLARPDVRFLNREPGSGSRMLMDLRLTEAGIGPDSIPGYRQTRAASHQEVAAGVAAGAADAGVTILASALARGLGVVPLAQEPYELVIPRHFLDLPAVTELLSALTSPALRRQIEALGGYDLAEMGREAGG